MAAWGASFGRAATPQDFGIEWNAEDELVRVTKDGGEAARYSYDPKGRRVEKVTGGTTTTYVYDREDVLKQVSGAATVRYVHGPGIDAPLATENGAGQLSYKHADGLSSELKETNATGAVALSRSYDAFGQPQVGAGTTGYAFTSREWDPLIQLQYSRARYYDPKVEAHAEQPPADPSGRGADPDDPRAGDGR